MRNLPPLNSLKAFDAVARNGSIKAAAAFLSVTPQAVSQQIKVLEEWLGEDLVQAEGQGLKLTEQGKKLEPFVAAAFAELEAGIWAVGKEEEFNQLSINATPYFANRFLIPALPQFRLQNSDLEIALTTRLATPDFREDGINLAIQWGYGDWDRASATLLFHDHKIICCAPALLEKQSLNGAKDLLDFPLLTTTVTERLWRDVFGFLKLDLSAAKIADAFDDAATMRQATQAGMGIGLISKEDAEEDLASGLLVAPLGLEALFAIPVDDVPAFYLLQPKSKKLSIQANLFQKWLLNLRS